MKRSEIKKRPMADTVLASLEADAKEYRELDGDGLYLRVKPDGSKSWQLRYKKPDGQWSWLGLGGYGKGEHQLTGEQARRKVRELRDATTKDGSMLATKHAKKAAEAEAANNTFEHLARDVCERWIRGFPEIDEDAEIRGVATARGQELAETAAQILDIEAVQ